MINTYMIKTVRLLGLCLFIIVSACQNTQQSKAYNEIEEEIPVSEVEEEEEDQELQEYGLVKHIEDGAYPFFVVSIEFPERGFQMDFDLNIEAIELDVTQLMDLLGKYATIHYTSEFENMLMDIHHNGETLLGAYAPDFDSEWEQLTGVLSGASQVTGGDLPDEITITDSTDNRHSFEYYIDDATVAVNGEEVTAYYYSRGKHTITKMEGVED